MRNSMTTVLLLAVLVPTLALGAIAEQVPAGPVIGAEVAELAFPLPESALLAEEDAWRADVGLPYRFALAEEVALTPNGSGTWDVDDAGHDRWRLRVRSRGAFSLNLAFTHFDLPEGGRLVLRPADGAGPGVAFDARANRSHGQLWAPIILTDDLLVELTVPPSLRSAVDLELGRINRGYRYFGEPETEKSGACNIDTACPAGDDWRAEINSVGVFTVSGTWKCTGAMINNTAVDSRPLFLTANHCTVSPANDHSVVVYWNYESPNCGDLGDGSLADFQTGSTLLANWATSDFSLLELTEQPEAAWGVTFAGWDRSGAVPDSAVCIHHPSTDEKAISFERDPLSISTYLRDESPGDSTHLRVEDWDLGTTEGGSSGSPLFDRDHRIVGQLHGGYASCVLNEPDWYGRLFTSWNGGGTSATSLAPHLDPGGTGATTLDLFDPLGSVIVVLPQEGAEFSGPMGGPFTPASAEWTIDNPGGMAVDWTVAEDADWLTVTPGGGTIAVDGQVTVSASLTAAAAGLAAGTHESELVFTNESGGAGSVTLPVTLVVSRLATGVVRFGPNPFRNFTEVVYSAGDAVPVRALIYDMRGRMVGMVDGGIASAGENVLVWDGNGNDGRHLPGGLYVMELDIGGAKSRISLTLAH